ncbi:COP9 signalosome complex subunit 3-like isoform X1 [Zingiber officinale]|uniref:COP9 signalosome complex subunit 3-like isoform X1 n=1 Tax=Zingiber officinale TaxID=94328 RepID=UPI001C4DA5DC|nr:COP9 signalosome complex subunit 3-like isoform X1 [Zingiber officinale]
MESVEVLVAHIQGLSRSPDEVSHLHSLLKQSEDALRSHASRLAPFLSQLDPSIHTLGYLFLLEAYSSGSISGEEASGFLLTVVEFINSCSAEQIQLAPEKFISVCKSFKDQVMQLGVPMQGIAPLWMAVRKLQTSTEQLTTLHSDYLLLCLLAKCYKAGLSILDDDIFEVDHPRDHFLYCYYGGMINIGLKRFEKALACLHNVVTAPMTTLNAICVEAYKKYILVSLILNGQVPSFPKYTSSAAHRNLKNYTQVANYPPSHARCSSSHLPRTNPCQPHPYALEPLSTLHQPLSISYARSEAPINLVSHSCHHGSHASSHILEIVFLEPYVDLANFYASGKFSELEACIQTNQEKFLSDSNLGLVKQVLSSLYKRNIQRLTQTYLTLSLQDIANVAQLNNPKEAEMHVLQMIQDGEIFATINQKDGMVSFHEDPEQYKSCRMTEHIDFSIQRLMALSKKLSSLDDNLSCDPQYLSKVGKERQKFDFDEFDSVSHKFM